MKSTNSTSIAAVRHRARKMAAAVAVMILFGSLSPITPKLLAGTPCGPVYKANPNDQWGWNWCVPDLPRVESRKLKWPDPRPPLTDSNSPYCWNTYIQTSYTPGQFAGGWYRTGKTQIRKAAWPDYYVIRLEYIVTYKLSTGFWSGWVYPPGGYRRVMSVNCDVP